MRPLLLSTLLAFSITPALAEEPSAETPNETARLSQQVHQLQSSLGQLQEQLAASEQERSTLEAQMSQQSAVPSAELDALQQQVKRLKHDNERLRQRLSEQSLEPKDNGLLNTQQTWYALGALTVVLSLLLGMMLRSGGKATKNAWLN